MGGSGDRRAASAGTETPEESWTSDWNIALTDSDAGAWHLECPLTALPQFAERLFERHGAAFATLVVEQSGRSRWRLSYLFYPLARGDPWIIVETTAEGERPTIPSLSSLANGPSVDWHEREAEDLFGLRFEGHPRLGEFVLHEDWPEGVNPMRRDFDGARPFLKREPAPAWRAPTIVAAPGSFAMPIGPVFSDFAESAHFLLETVGEDVIRTIPRFFYKYRGLEKIVEHRSPGRALLPVERFSGTSAFAHALAFCEAVEAIAGVEPPPRAVMLRTLFAELERLRHHAATITGICNSTALAIATAEAAIVEEDLLRLSATAARHRYLFGCCVPGGVACDLGAEQQRQIEKASRQAARRLSDLHQGLRYSSSFLDRLEEVGVVSADAAATYGLVGPIARASGVSRDLRQLHPYAAYDRIDFRVALESEGDGYARLRVLFHEAEQSAAMIGAALANLPETPISTPLTVAEPGQALTAVEAPAGAALHWLRLDATGTIERLRVSPPSFANWHGFHLAAENFAFQDFPIILASFGLSNAECDR